MPTHDKLNRAAEQYAKRIVSNIVMVWRYGLSPSVKQQIKKLKYHVDENYYKCRYLDYPAAVVSCSNAISSSIIKSDYSHACRVDKLSMTLKQVLKPLGIIGGIANNGCNNAIGHCAEVHAANKVSKKVPNTNSFIFSKAIRPRTMETVPYCINCKRVFNL